MPLTTAYFPTTELSKYITEDKNDSAANQEDSKENLCLRLTQNFQFYNERGCCDFQPSDDSSYTYKMAFRDIYSESKASLGLTTRLWFKYNENRDYNLQTVAQFHYLLYNHHTKRF